MSETKKTLIIYDTDMDTDCDDVGALAMILEYQKRGKAELIAVVADAISDYSAPACEAICNYYGVKVPVGSVCYSMYPRTEQGRYASYYQYLDRFLASSGCYARDLARLLGKRNADYPPVEQVYRKALANAPDKSVTVLAVGFMTAIERLFATEGDDISPLSGIELFEKKVKYVISMGHAEQPVVACKSFNYIQDANGAETVFAKSPVPIYVSGTGGSIRTGYSFPEKLPAGHPLRVVYEQFNHGAGKTRASSDQVVVLLGLEPNHPMLAVEPCGTIHYDAQTNTVFCDKENVTRPDCWVRSTASNEVLTDLIERMMVGDFGETESV